MSKVFKSQNSKKEMTPKEIAEAANVVQIRDRCTHMFKAKDFQEPNSRIEETSCGCEFYLMDSDASVKLQNYGHDDSKRWIICRKCGLVSHL